MIKPFTNYARAGAGCLYSLHYKRCMGTFENQLHTISKTTFVWKNMKWDEKLVKEAQALIFGKRKYIDFSPEEKKIVDFYQEKLLEEDCFILPNTGAALDQAKAELMMKEHYSDKV